LKISERN